MEIIIWFFAASFLFMAVALILTYRRTGHYGVLLLAEGRVKLCSITAEGKEHFQQILEDEASEVENTTAFRVRLAFQRITHHPARRPSAQRFIALVVGIQDGIFRRGRFF